jgi:hypothetical protein
MVVSFGQEAAPNARIWRICRDRRTEADDDQIEGWFDTLEMLLIFVRKQCGLD